MRSPTATARIPRGRPSVGAICASCLRFQLDPRAFEGLRTYYREAASLGVASGDRVLTFFPEAGRAGLP